MSIVTRDIRGGRMIVNAVVIGLLAAALVSGSALAGKPSGGGSGGGKGGGKPGGGTVLTATVVVAPNPVGAYTQFQISGCGYVPNGGVQFNMYTSGATAVWGGVADASGCLANAAGFAHEAGSARLDVLQGSATKVASTTFTIR